MDCVLSEWCLSGNDQCVLRTNHCFILGNQTFPHWKQVWLPDLQTLFRHWTSELHTCTINTGKEEAWCTGEEIKGVTARESWPFLAEKTAKESTILCWQMILINFLLNYASGNSIMSITCHASVRMRLPTRSSVNLFEPKIACLKNPSLQQAFRLRFQAYK